MLAVGEVGMHFVGDDDEVVALRDAGERAQLVRREDAPARVVRMAEQQQPHAFADDHLLERDEVDQIASAVRALGVALRPMRRQKRASRSRLSD